METDLAQNVARVATQIDTDSESSGDEGLVDHLSDPRCVRADGQGTEAGHRARAPLSRAAEALVRSAWPRRRRQVPEHLQRVRLLA